MWKYLLISAVILSAMPPMPGQTVKPAAQSGNKGQNQSQGNQSTPAQVLPLVNKPEQPVSADSYSGQVADKDKEHSVKLTSLPPVTLTDKHKTFWDHVLDWGPWVFNLLLAFAAGLQVWLLYRTWERIRRQADLMNRQAIVMVRQVEEMRKVSEIENKTLILQYRPKVIVRNATAKIFTTQLGEQAQCVLAFQIVNTGGSPAHIINGDTYLLFARSNGSIEEIEFIESTHVGIGERTLQPGERENIQTGLHARIINDERWVEFHAGGGSLHFIYLLGEVWYRDDLGIPRQVGLHRAYDPKTKKFIPGKDSEEEYTD